MGIKDRLRRLERGKPGDPTTGAPEQPVTEAQVLRELDGLIDRLDCERAGLQREREALEAGEEVEPYDDSASYGGESIEEHIARVDRLPAEVDARNQDDDERRKRYVAERGPTIFDEKIAELDRERAEIHAQLSALEAEPGGEDRDRFP